MVLPEPVDDHPGRHRMRGRREPVGQPAARVGYDGGAGRSSATSTPAAGDRRVRPCSPDDAFQDVHRRPLAESFQMAGIVAGGEGIETSIASISMASAPFVPLLPCLTSPGAS